MTLEINGEIYENISKVEIESEWTVETGLVIHFDLYCSCGGYLKTIDVTDFEQLKGLIKND